MNILLYGLIIIGVLAVFFKGFNIIAIILSILLLAAFILRNNAIKKKIYSPLNNQLHILNVDKGGVFTLRGVGENAEDMTLKVVAKHLYQEGDYYWYELECDKGTGENVWVEVEDDDNTVVSIMLKKLKLSDIGVTPSRLEQIDDNESGHIKYGGKTYEYADSDNAVYYKFCDDKNPQKFYYWDFENGKYIISVEKWSEDAVKIPSDVKFKPDYEVTLSQKLAKGQITVLSNYGEA